ncbi:DUF1700 domain-containing protein [Saccharothrix sp. ST-888]|uniref:DUF1700 domain-containing protein n=1 Tax=Saccharothrix sp. ST-888 TaxID=1427391 RepID=UPI0006962EC4|nr:hypothetical protein [Saccharothrix sp. ST-888]
MNDHHDQPLVHAYLAEVAQRTSALPDATRRELLANLREHIDVALAESDRADQETVRQILDRLGRPQAVADAALAEEGWPRAEAESPGRTTVTLGLIVLSLPLALIPAVGPVLALAATVTAVVRVWKSAQWVRKEKMQATLLLLSPVVVTPAIAVVLSLTASGVTPVALLAACAAAFCPPLVAAARLWRSAARIRTIGAIAEA